MAFDELRRAFIHCLVAHGYTADYLQSIFDGVDWSDRWHYLAKRVKLQQPTNQPAVVALTLPNTQRVNAMQLQLALFASAERWLAANEAVPPEVQHASFIIARTTVGKLASLLIDYRFLRER